MSAPRRRSARVLAFVQARTSSSRLPGKVLEDLAGRPVLIHVLDRLARASQLQGTVVATSTEPEDTAVAELAAAHGVSVVRGPLDDVLGRYAQALTEHPCDAVVRITADCPLIDPGIVDEVVARWRNGSATYVSNVAEPRSFPKGMDTEVVAAEALTTAAQEATSAYDREHVTPYVRTRPERFAQDEVRHEPSLGDLRLTLDTPEDLEMLRDVVRRAGADARLPALVEALRPSTR